MGKKSSDLSGYANAKKPWCPDCRAHRKFSVKNGKQTCLNCSRTAVFTPIFKQVAYIFHGSCAVFCLLLTGVLNGLFIFPALFFGWSSYKANARLQEWTEWAEEDAALRVKKKLRENQREKNEDARRAKDQQPASPPPVPPPLPPDADDDDD